MLTGEQFFNLTDVKWQEVQTQLTSFFKKTNKQKNTPSTWKNNSLVLFQFKCWQKLGQTSHAPPGPWMPPESNKIQQTWNKKSHVADGAFKVAHRGVAFTHSCWQEGKIQHKNKEIINSKRESSTFYQTGVWGWWFFFFFFFPSTKCQNFLHKSRKTHRKLKVERSESTSFWQTFTTLV